MFGEHVCVCVLYSNARSTPPSHPSPPQNQNQGKGHTHTHGNAPPATRRAPRHSPSETPTPHAWPPGRRGRRRPRPPRGPAPPSACGRGGTALLLVFVVGCWDICVGFGVGTALWCGVVGGGRTFEGEGRGYRRAQATVPNPTNNLTPTNTVPRRCCPPTNQPTNPKSMHPLRPTNNLKPTNTVPHRCCPRRAPGPHRGPLPPPPAFFKHKKKGVGVCVGGAVVNE